MNPPLVIYDVPEPTCNVPPTFRLDANVDVELAPVPRTSRNPLIVDVAVVEVAVNLSNTVCPATDNLAYGEVVPIPMLPDERVLPVPLMFSPKMV